MRLLIKLVNRRTHNLLSPVIAVPLPYTIVRLAGFLSTVIMTFTTFLKGLRYHITNEAIIGACLLPAGVGSMGS